MKKILLDTNAYSHLMRGDEQVFSMISSSEVIYMSVFIIGELYSGFKGGTKEHQNKDLLHKFLDKPSVQILEATMETAAVFAQVKYGLKKAGNFIPIHDVWIASQVIETGSVLVTYDLHFLKVPGLRLWDFLDK